MLVVSIKLVRGRHDLVKSRLVSYRQPDPYPKHMYALLLGVVGQGQGELGEEQASCDEDGEVRNFRSVPGCVRKHVIRQELEGVGLFGMESKGFSY